MAMAADVAIVEVEQLVEMGEIRAEDVHLPGVFVQRIYKGVDYENTIEIPILADS
jgi:3-oxoacid CoA-transferase subunit A